MLVKLSLLFDLMERSLEVRYFDELLFMPSFVVQQHRLNENSFYFLVLGYLLVVNIIMPAVNVSLSMLFNLIL